MGKSIKKPLERWTKSLFLLLLTVGSSFLKQNRIDFSFFFFPWNLKFSNSVNRLCTFIQAIDHTILLVGENGSKLNVKKILHIPLRFEAIFSHSFLIIIYFKCIIFQQKSYRMDTCIRPRSHLLPWISSMPPTSWPPGTGYPLASPTRQFCSCPCGSTAWGCSTQRMLAPFPIYRLGPPTHWEYGSVTQSVLLEKPWWFSGAGVRRSWYVPGWTLTKEDCG